MGMNHPPQFINIYLKKIVCILTVSMSNKDAVVRLYYPVQLPRAGVERLLCWWSSSPFLSLCSGFQICLLNPQIFTFWIITLLCPRLAGLVSWAEAILLPWDLEYLAVRTVPLCLWNFSYVWGTGSALGKGLWSREKSVPSLSVVVFYNEDHGYLGGGGLQCPPPWF